MLVLSHFKGHPMGGYGGGIKQLSLGVDAVLGLDALEQVVSAGIVGRVDEVETCLVKAGANIFT